MAREGITNRYSPGNWNPGQFGVVVKDMSGPVYYTPNLDYNDDSSDWDPDKPTEVKKTRWVQLAEIEADSFKERNDIDQNLRNDDIQSKQKALVCYDYMKNDIAKIIAICELLEINSDYEMNEDQLRLAVFTRINSDMRDRHGRKFSDLFIEIMTMEMENEAEPKSINIMFAHMIPSNINPAKDFEKAHGRDWARKAYDYILLHKTDFHLLDEFSCTLLNDDTILIYPRNYKKPIEVQEPLWYEEDLVTSQSYFAKENESTTIRRGIFDRFFR